MKADDARRAGVSSAIDLLTQSIDLSTSRVIAGPTMTIEVGEEYMKYRVHTELLNHHSAWFESLFIHRRMLGNPKTINMATTVLDTNNRTCKFSLHHDACLITISGVCTSQPLRSLSVHPVSSLRPGGIFGLD
jgi:hypothetical protein